MIKHLPHLAIALLIPAYTMGVAHAQGPAPDAAATPAEAFRIGFVNPDRVLREAQPSKNAQAKLEAEFSKRDQNLQAQDEALKSATEKFKREAPTLTDAQRQQRERALADQDRELQRKRREFQEDLSARKNEELQQVSDRTNRVLRQIAESEKYAAILQEALYINPKYDLTDKVIKAMNETASSPSNNGR